MAPLPRAHAPRCRQPRAGGRGRRDGAGGSPLSCLDSFSPTMARSARAWHRRSGAVRGWRKGALLAGMINIWGGRRCFDRRYPASNTPPICSGSGAVCAVFSSENGRNFCSRAPLFQRMRQRLHAAPEWTEAELVMLSWVVTFLVIALIAGILGFGGIAGVSIEIAKAVFFIAVVLFIISAVVGLARGRTRV